MISTLTRHPVVTLETGDRVRFLEQPDWGVGEVLSCDADGEAEVFFLMAGKRTLPVETPGIVRLAD